MSYTPPPTPPPGGYGPPGYGPPGYGPAPGYGPPPGYGQPPGNGYGGYPAEHPQGTTILVLGIVSLVFTFVCGLGALLGPVAWIMGNKAIKEIDASPQLYTNRGQIQGGRVCGIIASALLLLGVAFFVFIVLVGRANSSSGY